MNSKKWYHFSYLAILYTASTCTFSLKDRPSVSHSLFSKFMKFKSGYEFNIIASFPYTILHDKYEDILVGTNNYSNLLKLFSVL